MIKITFEVTGQVQVSDGEVAHEMYLRYVPQEGKATVYAEVHEAGWAVAQRFRQLPGCQVELYDEANQRIRAHLTRSAVGWVQTMIEWARNTDDLLDGILGTTIVSPAIHNLCHEAISALRTSINLLEARLQWYANRVCSRDVDRATNRPQG